MPEVSYSALEEALREEGVGISSGKRLASKYVRAANRKHTVEAEVILESMGANAPHNPRPPALAVMKERTEHTFLAYKFAQGLGAKEVFLDLGGEWDFERNAPISGTGSFCYQTLVNLRQQPWFLARIHKILQDNGADHVQAALVAELPKAIEVAREVMNNPEEKGATRLSAASFFFDRALGKAKQHVTIENTKGVEDFEKDAEALQNELNTIEMEITSMNAATVSNK